MQNHSHFSGSKKVLAVIPMVIGSVIMAAIVALLLGFVVLWLWNWLMPDIFGLTRITFGRHGDWWCWRTFCSSRFRIMTIIIIMNIGR